MGKIYNTQTDLVIYLETGVSLSGATDLKIKYRNPEGTVGEWAATIEDEAKGIIKYNVVSPLEFDGTWTLWAKVTTAGGSVSVGEATQILVYNEGKM